MNNDILNILKYLKEIELLKSVTRHSWMSSGRQESVAEHSWRMAMFAIAIAEYFPEADMKKVLEMCLIHDIGEAHEGDEPAYKAQSANKLEVEERSVRQILSHLPDELHARLFAIWEEYNACETLEAHIVKAIDKLEVLIQHNEADISTWEPEEIDLAFTHGKKYMEFSEFILAFRKVVDDMAQERIEKNELPY